MVVFLLFFCAKHLDHCKVFYSSLLVSKARAHPLTLFAYLQINLYRKPGFCFENITSLQNKARKSKEVK
jgi:hypothetical protein